MGPALSKPTKHKRNQYCEDSRGLFKDQAEEGRQKQKQQNRQNR